MGEAGGKNERTTDTNTHTHIGAMWQNLASTSIRTIW